MDKVEIIEALADGFHPAYNCAQYCFQSNSFKVSDGTKATFTIEVPDSIAGYSSGELIIILGKEYTTSNQNSYNTINTAPSQSNSEMAENFKQALESNSDIFEKFTFEVLGDVMVATAREEGVINDFMFDYSSLGATNPSAAPITTETQGSDTVYLENYRIVAEIWECENDILTNQILKDSRMPDKEGSLCIDFGKKLAPFLETLLACYEGMLTSSNWFADETISKEFCLIYGELYSDDLSECSIEPRTFYTGPKFTLFNGAFQDENFQEKFDNVNNNEWMSSMPDFSPLCDNTQMFLWINIGQILQDADASGLNVHPFYEFTYTDGTIIQRFGSQFTGGFDNQGFYAVGVGIPTISLILDSSKVLESWKASVIVRPPTSPPGVGTQYACKYFRRDATCCDMDISFCFLNEYGGYDTILFESVNTVELRSEYSIFESFIGCGGDSLRNGKDLLNNKAFDVFTATSKYFVDYEDREWLRQFIISPLKYAKFKVDGKEMFSKVILLDTSFTYWDEQDNVLRIFAQFILNKNLNIQKN